MQRGKHGIGAQFVQSLRRLAIHFDEGDPVPRRA